MAPAAKAGKKDKKKKGGDEAAPAQEQKGGAEEELDPEKAAKKVRMPGVCGWGEAAPGSRAWLPLRRRKCPWSGCCVVWVRPLNPPLMEDPCPPKP